jgi:hypothetical protein
MQGRRYRGGGGRGVTRPNSSNVGQSGTDICLKLKVKLGKIWSKFRIKEGRSYEMVRNFNNFKAFVMFAVKNLEDLLIVVEKI